MAISPDTETYSTIYDKLLDIIHRKSFKKSDTPIFKLASGRTSKYYVDCKPVLYDPEGMKLIGDIVLWELEDYLEKELIVDAVGGIETGAIPIALSASMRVKPGQNLKVFYVRKKLKDHGNIKWVEGNVKPGDKVAIVEDVYTTGASTLHSIKEAVKFGLKIKKVIILIDRHEEHKKELFNYCSCVSSIISLSSLKQYDKKITLSKPANLYRFVKNSVKTDGEDCSIKCKYYDEYGCNLFCKNRDLNQKRVMECKETF